MLDKFSTPSTFKFRTAAILFSIVGFFLLLAGIWTPIIMMEIDHEEEKFQESERLMHFYTSAFQEDFGEIFEYLFDVNHTINTRVKRDGLLEEYTPTSKEQACYDNILFDTIVGAYSATEIMRLKVWEVEILQHLISLYNDFISRRKNIENIQNHKLWFLGEDNIAIYYPCFSDEREKAVQKKDLFFNQAIAHRSSGFQEDIFIMCASEDENKCAENSSLLAGMEFFSFVSGIELERKQRFFMIEIPLAHLLTQIQDMEEKTGWKYSLFDEKAERVIFPVGKAGDTFLPAEKKHLLKIISQGDAGKNYDYFSYNEKVWHIRKLDYFDHKYWVSYRPTIHFMTWQNVLYISGGVFLILLLWGAIIYKVRASIVKPFRSHYRALREGLSDFHMLLDNIPVAIAIVDNEKHLIVHANNQLIHHLQIPAEEIDGRKISDFISQDSQEDFKTLEESNKKRAELLIKTSEHAFHAEVTSIITSFGGETIRVYIFNDITQRKEKERRLQRLATTDSLTGVYSRSYFLALADSFLLISQEKESQIAVFMLDIDYFKKINDRFGHKAGDKALYQFSLCLKNQLRSVDIIGRIGGEEFAVILSGTGRERSIHIAERIRRSVEELSILHAGNIIKFTVSIGICVCDIMSHIQGPGVPLCIGATTGSFHSESEKTETIGELIEKADIALYRAKHQGRNKVIVYQEGMEIS